MSDTTPDRYPGWPAWLTPEYSAIHTRLTNAHKRGTQGVYDSADGAGMDWTVGGMRSCQVSAILSQLRSDGWVPPSEAMTPVDEIGEPGAHDYDGPDELCDGCGECDYLDDRETVHGVAVRLCDGCITKRDEMMLEAARNWHNLEVLKSLSTPNTTTESITELGGYLEKLLDRVPDGDPKRVALDSLRTTLRVSLEAAS